MDMGFKPPMPQPLDKNTFDNRFYWSDLMRTVESKEKEFVALKDHAFSPYRAPGIASAWPYEILSDRQRTYLQDRKIISLTRTSLANSELSILDMYLEEGRPVLVMLNNLNMFSEMDVERHAQVLHVDPVGIDGKKHHIPIPEYLDDHVKEGILKNNGFMVEYDLGDDGKVLLACIALNPFERIRNPLDDYHP